MEENSSVESKILTNKYYKDKFHIYEYLKQHPGAVVAFCSVIFAVMAFLTNTLVYLYDKAYLTYWNIDPALIIINSSNKLYQISGQIISSIIMFFSLSFINGACEAYLDGKLVQRIEELFIKEIAEHKNNKSDLVDNNTDRDFDKDNVSVFVTHIIISFLLNYVGIVISSLISSKISWQLLLQQLCVSVITVIIMCTICISVNRKTINIKNNDSKGEKNEITELYKHIKFKVYPLSKKFKDIFSDENIKGTAWMMVFQVIALIINIYAIGAVSGRYKDEFGVIHIGEKEYAVVYNTGENYILEECYSEENTIRIYTKNQVIVPLINTEYTIDKYDEVVRITD